MSTKPPIAERMPSAICRNCFTAASRSARGRSADAAAPPGRSRCAAAAPGRRGRAPRARASCRPSAEVCRASADADERALFSRKPVCSRVKTVVERPRAAFPASRPPSAASAFRLFDCCWSVCEPHPASRTAARARARSVRASIRGARCYRSRISIGAAPLERARSPREPSIPPSNVRLEISMVAAIESRTNDPRGRLRARRLRRR